MSQRAERGPGPREETRSKNSVKSALTPDHCQDHGHLCVDILKVNGKVPLAAKSISASVSPKRTMVRIGTAGWTLPKQHAHHFAQEGSHLERCASGFRCVETNSSFHRSHRRKTWERWAASTPADFRFAVKIPKTITHTAKLHNTGALLQTFLDEANGLGEKLGPLLVQLPPSLAFDEGVAHEFFTTLRELHAGHVVLEPRHASWFTPGVNRLLTSFEVARVAADPPKGSPLAATPAGWPRLRYYRLHGAPRTYYSDYSDAFLESFAASLQEQKPAETWVIFDNTALGHATANALTLRAIMQS